MQSLSSISRTSPIGSQGFISVSDSIHQPDLVLAHLVGAAQGYEQVILASEIQACPGYSLIIDQAEFLGLAQNQLAIQSPATNPADMTMKTSKKIICQARHCSAVMAPQI